MYAEEFPQGWHHVAARRSGNRLTLHLDGRLVASSPELTADPFDVTVSQPLKIGFGPNDYFRGSLRDVRLYRGAVSDESIRNVAQSLRD